MDLNQFLTEYDDSLGGDQNVDPLGLQVIWSAFGQAIFQYRISSISNDVRNYTLNLFHHCLIKDLAEDERLELSPQLGKAFESLNTLNFKTACLIHLENLYTYSMISRQDEPGVDTGGVLGISKARRQWGDTNNSGGNPVLLFGDTDKSYILVRQPLLGVSGRYKTPLVQTDFFDKNYRYPPRSAPLWQQANALIERVPALERLYKALRAHLVELLTRSGAPRIAFQQVPAAIKSTYVEAFKSPAAVGSYARDFWLGVTQLDRGAAGALYRALAPSIASAKRSDLAPAEIFALATNGELHEDESQKLRRVLQLEPFLAELDLLFTLLLAGKQRTLAEVAAQWKGKYGRGPDTLRDAATDLEALLPKLSDTGARRLQRLLKLADAGDAETQMQQLLTYHNGVMQDRGQSPWLRLAADGKLKLDVRSRREPDPDDRPRGHWINHYYIPQFRNLLQGLLGGVA